MRRRPIRVRRSESPSFRPRPTLTLGAALGLLALTAACGGEASVPPAMTGIDVQGYGVALRLDPATLHLRGHAALAVRHDGTHPLVLELDGGMRVSDVRVDGRRAAHTHRRGRLRIALQHGVV